MARAASVMPARTSVRTSPGPSGRIPSKTGSPKRFSTPLQIVAMQQVVGCQPAGNGGQIADDHLVEQHGGDCRLRVNAEAGQGAGYADGRDRGPASGDRDQ